MNIKAMLTKAVSTVFKCCKDNAPTALTITGLGLGTATVVLVAKEAPKAKAKKIIAKNKAEAEGKSKVATEVEIIKSTAPTYLPAIITGTAAAGCFIASNVISNKRLVKTNEKLAQAVAGMGFLQNKISTMQETAKEVLGDNKAEDLKRKTHEKMMEQSKNTPDNPIQYDSEMLGVPQLFYDPMGHRFIRSSVDELRAAENKLNIMIHNEYMDGSVDEENWAGPNEFYSLMGWEPVPYADAWIFNPRACFHYDDGVHMVLGKIPAISKTGEAAISIEFENLEERWKKRDRKNV